MGFETFRIKLHGGTATFAQAVAAVRELPHVLPDHESIQVPGSAYYFVDDGSHIIEIEVAAAPVRVSCRFTLCHPPSIDAAFLSLVQVLQNRLRMDAKICDDVRPEHAGDYSAWRFAEFATASLEYQSARRAEWIAQFGPTQLAAKTSEVYTKMILPKCEPVVV